MLLHKDGCLFVEWDQVLHHALTAERFCMILDSSELHFANGNDWYDANEDLGVKVMSELSGRPQQADFEVSAPKEYFFGHCWYAIDHVENSMWSGNDSSPRRVILKTSFKSLHDAISSEHVYAGKVAYRYVKNFEMNELSAFAKKFVKDRRFSDEEELRLLISLDRGERNDPTFVKVSVDLQVLVEEIVVRSRVPDGDFEEIVEAATKVGLQSRIRREA